MFHEHIAVTSFGRDCVSKHQARDCLLNRLFRRSSKKTPKLRVTGLCERVHRWPVNSPHKGTVTRKMFSFDDVIMKYLSEVLLGDLALAGLVIHVEVFPENGSVLHHPVLEPRYDLFWHHVARFVLCSLVHCCLATMEYHRGKFTNETLTKCPLFGWRRLPMYFLKSKYSDFE